MKHEKEKISVVDCEADNQKFVYPNVWSEIKKWFLSGSFAVRFIKFLFIGMFLLYEVARIMHALQK